MTDPDLSTAKEKLNKKVEVYKKALEIAKMHQEASTLSKPGEPGNFHRKRL